MAASRHAVSAAGRPHRRPGTSPTIDLHCHTRRSDGILEPGDLVRAAAEAGVRTLAISDHDSLAAFRELTAPGAAPLPSGLDLIPAIEINAVGGGLGEGIETHVLGYGMDPNDEAFEATLVGQRNARRIRFDAMLGRLRALGLSIDPEIERLGDPGDDALGRPTVARALIAAGHAISVEDAFDRLLSRGRPAYVAREGLGPVEAIAAIRAAGGLAALAHDPGAADHVERLVELRAAGLRGLEVFHRSFDDATRASVGAVAARLGLVRTGGTDYHGDLGPYADALGELVIDAGVADEVHAALGDSRPPDRHETIAR
jgi:predicted metal-dependent phosphoesterase TrpH